MKKLSDEERANQFSLIEIGYEMFAEQVVWKTKTFDEELQRRWEKRTKRKAVDLGMMTGRRRTRFENLVDWVKAYFTDHGKTMKVIVSGEEYRIWINSVGQVNGVMLTSHEHWHKTVEALIDLFPQM
jgi:hypothetical protein